LSLLCDTVKGTLSLADEHGYERERGHAIGNHARLETPEATVYLDESTLTGSGPTGPGVTLILAVSFKPHPDDFKHEGGEFKGDAHDFKHDQDHFKHEAASRLLAVEVGGSDDLGHVDGFAHAGWLTIQPEMTVAVTPEPPAELGEGP
jgi:hypothetical protein